MLNDFAVGPFVFDFTYSAFDANPSGGSDPIRFVASITVLPSMPWTVSSASATDSPGTASRTASASETSPPSRPIRVTSCPAFSQRSASPPPTLPLPTTAIFIPRSSRRRRWHPLLQAGGTGSAAGAHESRLARRVARRVAGDHPHGEADAAVVLQRPTRDAALSLRHPQC